MSEEKQKNGRIPLQTVIAIVMALAALGGSWWTFGKETGELKQRVDTVESRQKEDRREIKESLKEQKQDTKDLKSDVQRILIKLEAMEQRQRR